MSEAEIFEQESPSGTGWKARPVGELVAEQVAALDAWNRAMAARARAAEVQADSRELRLDAARRLDVLRTERAALIHRAEEQLRDTRRVLGEEGPRVVVAHRNDWFRDRVGACLENEGLTVVASVGDGAHAAAAVVLDQPDLLLVEDLLPQLRGVEVVERAQEFAPRTVVAAQVQGPESSGPLREAGSRAVFGRRIPPTDVAQHLVRCLYEDVEVVLL